jgi:archaeosortase A (PGF-CTERM-specific)
LLALPFYAYLGYHEYLSYIWDEDNMSLKWITGASFFAAGLYFLVDRIPILSGYVIYGVAVQTVWLVNIFGLGYGVGDINYAGNPLWYRTNYNEISVPIEGSSVAIIQSCTAIQSMLIFIGAIYCVQALKKSKWYAFFATVPVIYVLNLIRNLGIIYMMDVLGWSYDFSHNTVGKAGSFLALIVLAFIAFKLLPELLDNIWGILDLRDRGKKKEEEEKGDVEKEELEEDSEVVEEKGDFEEEMEKEELEEEEHEEVVEEKGEGKVKEESRDEKEIHEVEGDGDIDGEEEVEEETEEEIEEG